MTTKILALLLTLGTLSQGAFAGCSGLKSLSERRSDAQLEELRHGREAREETRPEPVAGDYEVPDPVYYERLARLGGIEWSSVRDPLLRPADPSKPFETSDGKVISLGTHGKYFEWTREAFAAGEKPKIRKLQLYQPDGVTRADGVEDVWDPMLHRNPDGSLFLIGGIMTSPREGKKPIWPRHNTRRELRVFELRDGKWVAARQGLIAREDIESFVKHSYGHALEVDPETGKQYLLSDLVFSPRANQEVMHDYPLATGIYAHEFLPNRTTQGPPIKIFDPLDFDYPAFDRADSLGRPNNFVLAEGLRPELFPDRKHWVGLISGGDYFGDSYNVAMIHSKSLIQENGWKPVLNAAKTDVVDFGAPLKKALGVTGAGRAVLFRRNGELRIALHFYRRIANQDYKRFPRETFDQNRRVVVDFPAKLEWDAEGNPTNLIIGKPDAVKALDAELAASSARPRARRY